MSNLDLVDADLACSEFVDITRLFKSLESVDMSFNPITDLTPLDKLLCEGSELKRLEITLESVSESNWVEFLHKLPRMQSLRNLGISFRPFAEYSEALRASFLDALWNSSIESVHFMDDEEDNSQVFRGFEEFRCQVSVPVSLNRRGRQALQNQYPGQPMYQSLWPRVLQRAMNIDYYSALDSWEHPTLKTRRCDVLYWLLREKVLV